MSHIRTPCYEHCLSEVLNSKRLTLESKAGYTLFFLNVYYLYENLCVATMERRELLLELRSMNISVEGS